VIDPTGELELLSAPDALVVKPMPYVAVITPVPFGVGLPLVAVVTPPLVVMEQQITLVTAVGAGAMVYVSPLPKVSVWVSDEVLIVRESLDPLAVAAGLVTPLITTSTDPSAGMATGVVIVAVAVPPPLTEDAATPFTT
jgi:hypothetical protein